MSTRSGRLFLTLTLATVTAVVTVTPVTAGRLPGTVPGAAAGFADVVERSVPGVVRILTAGPSGRSSFQRASGEGSGLIVTPDGYILTNQHVVEAAARITVQLADDREFAARLIAADPPTDLAVLKIEAGPLPVLALDSSARLRVGDYVLAVGNPFGVGTSVSLGIVSALGAEDGLIQTDAAINPGNSGGPLLNAAGDVVGISTAIVSPSGGSNGVGLAIPVHVARRVFDQLMTAGAVRRGYLGVGLQPVSPALTEALGAPRSGGAVITDVAPASPAADAGLAKGDLVLALNGRAVRDFHRLRFLIAAAQPGTPVQLTVARDGVERTLSTTLAERPTPTGAAVPERATGEVLDSLPGAVVADLSAALRQTLQLDASLQGALVTAVDPEGVSAEAGLRPGDVIVEVNRRTVPNAESLARSLTTSRNKPALIEVRRHDGTYFVALAPAAAAR